MRSRLLLKFFRLAAQRLVENLLRVGDVKNRGGAAAGRFRNAEGVAGARTGVEVGKKFSFGDQRGAIGEAGLNGGELNIGAVLQREFNGAFQSEAPRSCCRDVGGLIGGEAPALTCCDGSNLSASECFRRSSVAHERRRQRK